MGQTLNCGEWCDLVKVEAVGQEGDWIGIERQIPICKHNHNWLISGVASSKLRV